MSDPSNDSDPEPGMLWLNLVGLGLIFTLISVFFILYGARLLELLGWLTGADPRLDPRIR